MKYKVHKRCVSSNECSDHILCIHKEWHDVDTDCGDDDALCIINNERSARCVSADVYEEEWKIEREAERIRSKSW